MTSNKIETVIKSLAFKVRPALDELIVESDKTFKEKQLSCLCQSGSQSLETY